MLSIENNNELLRKQIETLLSLNIGISIEIGGSIYIRNNGGKEYVVGGVEEKNPYQVNQWKKTFDNIGIAIDYLITKRTQDKLGNDFFS